MNLPSSDLKPPATADADDFQSLTNAIVVGIQSMDSIEELRLILAIFEQWLQMRPKQRALLIKALFPTIVDQKVADCCGVRRRTLYRWPEFRRLKSLVGQRFSMFRGHKCADGVVEAFDERRDAD
jgi:hypothetical protein